ncbi:ABC transporter permease [Chitinophaga defluvii]|uniref:FtsX-like permease family protein n=1 Tax=Chitinophaga defluvii TaxID=3163343 RepID=A0ABV2T930_9BACT
MLTHLFKLIWNKKKHNFLLIIEMLASFLVMFAVFTLLVNYYQHYKAPMNFEYKNVWAVTYEKPQGVNNKDSLVMIYETLRNTLTAMPEVEAVSIMSSNSPFSMSNSSANIRYGKINLLINQYFTDDDFDKVMGVTMQAGRWFSKADAGSKIMPVIINTTMNERYFGQENAIGKIIGNEQEQLRVIGVVKTLKEKGDYAAPEMGIYRRPDSTSYNWLHRMMVKVRPDANNATFESRFAKVFAGSLKDSNVEIEHLTDKRIARNNLTLVPLLVMLIIACFLLINVALGLFGVLWYNISKRKSEIGLRRALGATGPAISLQMVSEALVLSTLAVLVGVFFAIQFPLLNVFDLPANVYFKGIALSVIFIYLLVIICAFYPGRQAANIYPAVALHEE